MDVKLTHGAAATELLARLEPWANQMAARFGYAVWLVGSALRLPNPRDVDIRVELPDADFEARYGLPVGVWAGGLWDEKSYRTCRAPMQAYFADMADLTREAALVLRLNLDFAVQPHRVARVWYPRETNDRMRLDSVPTAKEMA